MEIFYHIPERRISLVRSREWGSPAHGAYWVLVPWTSRLSAFPTSDLGDRLVPAFGYSIGVTPMTDWKRVGDVAVAMIYILYIQRFT